MSRTISVFLFLVCTLLGRPPSTAPAAEVRIEVDPAKVLYQMQGGIGASWHAIETPILGRGWGGYPAAGSGWGANPDPDDQAAWQQVYHHANWLGLDWCRVEVEQRMYEPERGRFDWNSRDMRILYRILDYCQQRGVDVFLQQMWANVAWNAFPEWRGDSADRVKSGPLSMTDFAGGLAALVEHLLREKRYTCIRWLSIINEPGHALAWQKPPDQCMPITPGLAAVRQALDRKGLWLPLSAPDWTDLPTFAEKEIDFDPLIGAYDLHSYWANFEGSTNGYSLSDAEQRLRVWADWAHARHKPFFLSEMGTVAYGWRGHDPGPGTYPSALKDAELVIRGLAAGVDGFNRWSFINRGDLDGQWQLIDTWDVQAGKLLKSFTPHPNSYFVFGLLSRFTAKHSEVLSCKVEAGGSPPHLFAAALRSPNGNLTVPVVNDGSAEAEGTLAILGLKQTLALYKYQVTSAQRDLAVLKINPGKKRLLLPNSPGFRDRFPRTSLTVYSTYRLAHSDSGIIAE